MRRGWLKLKEIRFQPVSELSKADACVAVHKYQPAENALSAKTSLKLSLRPRVGAFKFGSYIQWIVGLGYCVLLMTDVASRGGCGKDVVMLHVLWSWIWAYIPTDTFPLNNIRRRQKWTRVGCNHECNHAIAKIGKKSVIYMKFLETV